MEEKIMGNKRSIKILMYMVIFLLCMVGISQAWHVTINGIDYPVYCDSVPACIPITTIPTTTTTTTTVITTTTSTTTISITSTTTTTTTGGTTTTIIYTGNHIWSKSFGSSSGTQYIYGNDVATDSSGNVVMTGSFQGTTNFGGNSLTSAGSDDIFLAKYSPSGVHLWSKKIGGVSSDIGKSVTIDNNGDIFVTGYFQSIVDFGGGGLTSAGISDIFVVKYSAFGNHLWSKRFGSTSNDRGYDITTDASGNVIVTGYFVGSVDFGNGTLVSAGGSDCFIIKYSSTGTHILSKRIGGTSSDIGQGVVVAPNGDISVVGYYSGTADFGGGSLISAGSNDIFLACYSSTGTHLWSKRFGSTSSDYGYGIALNGNSNVVITGNFSGSVDFGGVVLISTGVDDMFVAKYNTNGSHIWSKKFGTTLNYDVAARAIAIDNDGNILLTGTLSAAVNFGCGGLSGYQTWDIFIVKLNSSGSCIWSKRFGASYDDQGYAIATDSSGNVFTTGAFFVSVNFGGGVLNSTNGTGFDAFLVKFAP